MAGPKINEQLKRLNETNQSIEEMISYCEPINFGLQSLLETFDTALLTRGLQGDEELLEMRRKIHLKKEVNFAYLSALRKIESKLNP